jgi:capsular polysaccharide export protein
MNLLILEPPYSHLFKELAKALKPKRTHVHLFNLGYLIYLPNLRFSLISQKLKHRTPSKASVRCVREIRSLANSNIKTPTAYELRLMANYLEYLREFLAENHITHIICHNDLRWQHAVARQVAREAGVEIFFSEEGLFRPHTLTFDSKGVNAFSSVPRSQEFYRRQHFTPRPTFRPLIKRQLKRGLRLVYFLNFMLLNKIGDLLKVNVPLKNKNYSINQYAKLFFAKLRKVNRPSARLSLTRKFIFVPLQVTTDTQTIIHSTFAGTQQVIELIEAAYEKLPPSLKSEYALVFKQHPMEGHLTYQFHADSIVSTEGTGSLLSKCDLVVLVNSTTIVEALTKQKKIITLGESHYNIPGLLRRSDGERLAGDIRDSLESPSRPEPELVESFLNYLKYHYQINGNIFYYDQDTINQLKTRLYAKTPP